MHGKFSDDQDSCECCKWYLTVEISGEKKAYNIDLLLQWQICAACISHNLSPIECVDSVHVPLSGRQKIPPVPTPLLWWYRTVK